MIYREHRPAGILEPYIENIIFFEGYTAPHRADKLLPDGGIYLIINMLEKSGKLYKDEALTEWQEFTGCFISGQQRGFIFIEADHASNMAIKFKLGGAAALFDFPISRLNNKVFQVEPWLEGITAVRRQIISEKSVDAKLAIIETYLQNTLRKDFKYNLAFAEVLEFLQTHPEHAGIKGLADRMNISQKHLISLFARQVGLNPKALARIFRFQKVIGTLESGKKADWMQIATDCGYYDQAHFVKDFYAFSGIRPGGYAEKKGEYVNYIPVN